MSTSARTKYPRTPHLGWSPGSDEDDIAIERGAALFSCSDVVVTLKMDGENTTVYPDGTCHARSVDSISHPSRTWMRAQAANLGAQLPDRWRLCGENLYAVHSIRYDDLSPWFYVFSIWDGTRAGGSTGYADLTDGGIALDWDTTCEWAELLGTPTVPVIYRGPFDAKVITAAFEPHRAHHEGYVVRDAGEIRADEFNQRAAKWVRAQHVQTDEHWLDKAVEVNGLAPTTTAVS
jgi:hypothetical protein